MLFLLARSPTALAQSGCGVTIGVELLAFAVPLSLAAWNKLRLTPALLDGNPTAAPALRRSIAGEFTVVPIILTLTAILTTTSPPVS